jgi:LPS-assembly protein
MFYLLLFWAPLAALATPMNLVSDLPMEFDGQTHAMVARQNATFTKGDLILTADEIRFNKETQIAEATGDARANFKTMRLVAPKLTYDVANGFFEADDFRLGYFPYMIVGKHISGTREKVEIRDAMVSASQTGLEAPRVGVKRATLYPNDNMTRAMVGPMVLKFGALPLLPLPGFYATVPHQNMPTLKAQVGKSGNKGIFLRTETLVGVSKNVGLGANLDYYTKRGILLGPRLAWQAGSFLTTLTSGYISDRGSRGEDVNGLPIDEERGFVEARSKGNIGSVSVTAQLQYRSDSEVLRDFRPDAYEQSPAADSFIEAVWPLDGAYVSAFLRANPNNFDDQITRLPEVRFDKLSTPLGTSGWYYSWLNSAARLENDAGEDVNRVDSLLTVKRPTQVTPWWNLTPLAGGRLTYYSKQADSSEHIARTLAQVGLDSTWTFSRIWDVQSSLWNMDGLRHLVQPTLQYRYFPNVDAYRSQILGMDVDNLGSSVLGPMDAWEMTNVDDLTNRQVLRMGLKQSLQTRQKSTQGFPSRELVSFDVYQDFILSSADDKNKIGDFYIVSALHPASWLEAGVSTRMSWDDLSWKQHNIWTTVRDGDQWSMTLSSHFLESDTKQYGVRATYRLTDAWSVLAETTYDGYRHGWSYICAGLAQRLRSGWEAFYGLTRSEGDDRDSSTRLTLRISCLQF